MTAIPPDPAHRSRLLRWLTDPASLLYRRTDPLTLPPDLDVRAGQPVITDNYPAVNDPAREVEHLRRRVAELHHANSVDEGTSTVLDGRTAAVQDLRELQASLEYLNKRWRLRYHRASLDARIAIRNGRIDELEQEIRDVDQALADDARRQREQRTPAQPRRRRLRTPADQEGTS